MQTHCVNPLQSTCVTHDKTMYKMAHCNIRWQYKQIHERMCGTSQLWKLFTHTKDYITPHTGWHGRDSLYVSVLQSYYPVSSRHKKGYVISCVYVCILRCKISVVCMVSSGSKTTGKALIVLPFAHRHHECDGWLLVHFRSKTTPVSLLAHVCPLGVARDQESDW